MIGLVCLAAGLLCLLCLISYHAQDGSWKTAAGSVRPLNLTGRMGSHVADLMLQVFGSAAFLFPLIALALSWKWLRSESIKAPLIKAAGWEVLVLTVCAGSSLIPSWRLFDGVILPGGGIGSIVAEWMKSALNLAGTAIVLGTCLLISIYVTSSFSLTRMPIWLTWPLRQGFVSVGIGLVLGITGALMLTSYLRSLLYEVSATDPLVFGGISIALAFVALLAMSIPAREAARVDPLKTLRHE